MKREKLITLRKEKGLTQAKLAENLGISTIYVRKIEHGYVSAGRKTMLKYENFFDKDMKELFPDLFFEDNVTKFNLTESN
ncbi:XRE family transcriptional regulator [Salicibibacter halophilus]|uniref:XRE family transcriptional regulator n=1 Tax=Salicibibacter halophilus TaxID=2502791 RepID=A0A514LEJ3_9BACI|nr:helix-turn-helix transcriptional regulator [Salicibibacter halophilus]QDI90249.1 XRE family transcriptional regulator [Salicibibacter halophilus]